MRSVYRAFRKRYLLCRDVMTQMVASGGFTFHIDATQAGAEAKLDTPDQQLAMRFVVVTRRCIDREDRIYFKAVWEQLVSEFGESIPYELTKAVGQAIRRVTQGDIRIELNGEQLAAETIYDAIAESYYDAIAESYMFGRNERFNWITSQMSAVPLLAPLLWHQFYAYAQNVLALASGIVEAIKVVEGTEKFQQMYGDPKVARCIYCLGTDGPFTSEEHIVPESMGNNDYVLPRGYVCDRCNNGPLALLDNALRNCPLFITQVPGAVNFDKRGRLPEVKLGEITVRRDHPLNVTWTADSGSDAIKVVAERPDGQVEFRVQTTLPSALDETALARALCRIGLAAIALDIGHEHACSPRFDRTRDYILHGGDFNNCLLIS